ncbi:ATP-binding protein [uncultured Piscinibacter sp.]|uniref:ATP-binding protein n=1 Tax=uncultured Piscinibacter sp. TaxID=1131835 RepID=UPI00260ADB64|nr:ATP-binding protein [uncultured Piscinibacter sp.]
MNRSGPASGLSGEPLNPSSVGSAFALEQELARRLLNLMAGLILVASGAFLAANLWSALWPEAALSLAVVLGTFFAWRHARHRGRATLGIRMLAWTTFVGLSGGLLRQGSTMGPAIWWLSALPLLLLQGGALIDGVLMTMFVVAEAVFAATIAAALGIVSVDPEQLGTVRRDVAIVGALTVNALVLLMGIRWRRALLAQLDETRLRAEEAVNVKSRFLANMSHEIRTPLHGIVGSAELLRGTRLDEGQRQVLRVLRRSSSALLALVNDVLDLSKLEAGRMRVEQERFDLHDAVHDAAEVFSAQAEAKGVDLLSHCAADLPQHTVGDAARLRQILHNLVGNAVKFTAAGEVRVFAAPERGADGSAWVRVSVRDSGIGMSEAQLAGLFEAFAQADLSTTRRFGGSGLGLAIARELATLLGGRIEVQSLPGQGSTFMLLLPLVASAAPEPPAALLADIEVHVISPSRSRREDLAELVQRHGGRCETFDVMAAAAGALPPGARRIVVCDERALSAAGTTASQWSDDLARRGERGVLLVGLAADARRLPRELLPLYRPAPPGRVVETLRRAFDARPPDSARADLDEPLHLQGAASPRVLLVEDNLVNQMVAQALLERLGATVVLAGDGEQALQRLADAVFDLVLMDCQMPVLDGHQCARRWREIEARTQRPRIPVVAMTATSDEDAREACLAAGMDDFLVKPVAQADLAALLARVVHGTAR